jgi:hypothetical protein
MGRSPRIVAALAAAPLLAGCAMCHTPYDYAGPVVGKNGCPTLGFHERAGSTAASGHVAHGPTLASAPSTTHTAAPTRTARSGAAQPPAEEAEVEPADEKTR